MLAVPEMGLQVLYSGSSPEQSPVPSPPGSPRTQESCGIAPLTLSQSPKPEARAPQQAPFSVVVAFDFGTTSSSYAFSFASDPEAIHMMREQELRMSDGTHGPMDREDPMNPHLPAKFKMKIHSATDLTLKTQLEAVNGKKMPALEVFTHALRFFKEHALQELRDQCPSLPEKDIVRWVLTVPAIWKQPAKQFMREAAYLAGLVSREDAEQLLIALEPEAASVYCRKLRLHQLVDLSSRAPGSGCLGESHSIYPSFRQAREQLRRSRHSQLWAEMQAGDRYVVADCGGGTVDLTMPQLEQPHGTLKELYKASGGPCGAVAVDLGFEQLLGRIFGEDFISTFKTQRPAAWVDLTIAFEACKRTAGPHHAGALNISLPFSFIDFYCKQRGHNVETALRRSSVNFVKWSSQGTLRMSCEAMNDLLQPTVSGIIQHIEALLARPEVQGVKLLFLVGSFSESAVLQHAVQAALGGAVLFGQAPGMVRVRRSPLTYSVDVLNLFVAGRHPPDKLLVRGGRRWCTDVFERFVAAEQSVALGEDVLRSYCPARPGQRCVLINLCCCAAQDAHPGLRKCGELSLELAPAEGGPRAAGAPPSRREIRTAMQFGDPEIKVTALDVSTNRSVRAAIDFLSNWGRSASPPLPR
uniref:Heat shock 70 kDa protein 12B n=1 Tax=Phocoena sinus TaxID=42100 RepID=A0A8C9C638_PHOSS